MLSRQRQRRRTGGNTCRKKLWLSKE
jgi:hypothetical protein